MLLLSYSLAWGEIASMPMRIIKEPVPAVSLLSFSSPSNWTRTLRFAPSSPSRSRFRLWRIRRRSSRFHMTEDSGVRVSSDEPIAVPIIDSSSQTKQRYFSSLHILSYLISLLVRFISLEKMSEILVVLFWMMSSFVLLCCHKIYRFTRL